MLRLIAVYSVLFNAVPCLEHYTENLDISHLPGNKVSSTCCSIAMVGWNLCYQSIGSKSISNTELEAACNDELNFFWREMFPCVSKRASHVGYVAGEHSFQLYKRVWQCEQTAFWCPPQTSSLHTTELSNRGAPPYPDTGNLSWHHALSFFVLSNFTSLKSHPSYSLIST